MNRLIIVGNGFDLAHGLKTQYIDFLSDYWGKVKYTNHSDPFYDFYNLDVNLSEAKSFQDALKIIKSYGFDIRRHSYSNPLSVEYKLKDKVVINIINKLFHHLNETHSQVNWVDIEMEYYKLLKKFLTPSIREQIISNERGLFDKIKSLNDDLSLISKEFETYLNENIISNIKDLKIEGIQKILSNDILDENWDKSTFYKEFPTRYKTKIFDSFRYLQNNNLPYTKYQNTHVLNFNYTNTIGNYFKDSTNSITLNSIHGVINDFNNPINLGFGDERDKFYSEIEDYNKNEYLRFMKSFFYSNTDNYKTLVDFLEEGSYQVQIMGHSCGLSDRTLLNTIFEHDNCYSIKVFYHKYDEVKSDGIADNFSDLVKNISRHFKDKENMRIKIVDKTLCEPLPQIY